MEIKSEEATEYLQPLAELEENMRIRSEVAGILRQYRLKNIENQFEAEELTAKQNFEVWIEIENRYCKSLNVSFLNFVKCVSKNGI